MIRSVEPGQNRHQHSTGHGAVGGEGVFCGPEEQLSGRRKSDCVLKPCSAGHIRSDSVWALWRLSCSNRQRCPSFMAC